MCATGPCCGDEEAGCPEIAEIYRRAFGMFGGYGYPHGYGSAMNPESRAMSGPVDSPHVTVPRDIADPMAMVCQQAVRWFHEPKHVFLGDPTVRTIPDQEVRDRLAGYQEELDKELDRVHRITSSDVKAIPPNGPGVLGYELSKMPFARQRALVERWEHIWVDWMEAHPGWTVTSEGFIPPKPKTITKQS